MQTARKLGLSLKACRQRPLASCLHFSTVPSSSSVPWFVDPEESSFSNRHAPPHLKNVPETPSQRPAAPSVPSNVPEAIRNLHVMLAQSPHLDQSRLLVGPPLSLPMGPPLPRRLPHGRRKRGGTDAGMGVNEPPGSVWSWVVMAQVKEGTENRGAIESVVRVIRKTLLTMQPPLPLPPNSKRRDHNGWALVDAGDFAVHVLSKDAWERYFGDPQRW
ncbi:hypothetical protein PLICRDRAFT_108890 [Plicaturopsis crispa FD-325 SS-3]|nr:hypothetical protein PLICRDRAFT_108890 [Plicaturopsis crispa FD-325 SS-3]